VWTRCRVLHYLFWRFPELAVATVENGSLRVGRLMKGHGQDERYGRVGALAAARHRPSDIFREPVWVALA
jgi:hypothetical protein